MRYIRRIVLISIVCVFIFMNTAYSQNASIGDTLITCNEDGTQTGKGEPFTKANITISNIDESGYYSYYGVDIGAFKKPQSGETWDSIIIERIPTNSLEIEIEDFGDITQYEYDTVYTLGYRVLYRPNGTETNPIIETEWIKVEDSCFKVINTSIPTLNTLEVTGTGYYGDDIILKGTGANIHIAEYRMFYTTDADFPEVVDNNNDGMPDGWLEPNPQKKGELQVKDNVSILGTISGGDLSSRVWTYVVFKIGAASADNKWTIKYTNPYKLSDNPNSNFIGENVDSYVNHIRHNQIIKVDGKDMILSDPNVPVGTYDASDINRIEDFNTFIDGDILKYRVEFDVVKPENIKDMRMILDLNSLNDRELEVVLNGAKLYKLIGGEYTLIKDLGSSYRAYKPQSRNKYIIALGNDNAGTPMIIANGKGTYALEYTGVLKVNFNQRERDVLMENEVEIRVNIGNNNYMGTVCNDIPSNKAYIATKVFKKRVVLG